MILANKGTFHQHKLNRTFYLVVFIYFLLFDIGSRSFQEVPAAMRYAKIFSDLGFLLENLYNYLGSPEHAKRATDLWTSHIAHITKKTSRDLNYKMIYRTNLMVLLKRQ